MVQNRKLVVVGILLALAMAAMEATVVGTAMPTVVQDLGGLEYYGWVGAIYLLAATVTMPLYGKLADSYGRKKLMMVGLGLFLLGSIGCGLAHSMTALIAMRGLQGLGAGGLQPIAFTIIGDLFKPAERARIQGVFGTVWGLAGMTGPLLGGLLVDVLSWHWVFFINVPFAVLSALVLQIFFTENVERKTHELDLVGALLLTITVVGLLLGSSHIYPAACFAVSAVTLVLFVRVERVAKEPVLPLELLGRRVLLVGNIAGTVLGAVMAGLATYTPLYVVALRDGTPTEAGGTIAPMLIGWPIASALSARLLLRVGYRPMVLAGFFLVTAAAATFNLLVAREAPLFMLATCIFFLGVGLGTANTPLVIAVQESAAWNERGVATASMTFFRSIGSALCVGALGALIAMRLGDNVPREVVDALLHPGRGAAPHPALAGLSERLAQGLVESFMVVAALAVVALGAAMFFPNTRLRREKPAQDSAA